jgi:FAD/FMN-containing dehydrogenase
MPEGTAAHAARVERARRSLREASGAAPIGLAKRSSNLFRDRRRAHRPRLDLHELGQVLGVDREHGLVDTEGLVSYEVLADATLAHGAMPAVVPQLKSITAGGAVAGVGIEASSFRHGLVHDTLREAEVLLASGDVLVCRADNEHRELFLALPNSYGTLGYLLRVVLATQPVRPFVRVEHRRFASPGAFFAALSTACADTAADFVDGVVFARDDFVLEVASFVDDAPATSDYTGRLIYHRSLREKALDWLTTRNWLWRWDTDWFWCSRRFGAERPWVRALLGPGRLNSRSYTRLMRLDARLGLSRGLARLRGVVHRESVIQDVDLPRETAGEFLEFLLREIRILPIWVCPIRAPSLPFTLYPLRAHTPYVNFGFWDTLETDRALEPGHFNRLVEQQVAALGGIKSLYSDCFFSREAFAAAYGGPSYAALKARYDPHGRLPGLYEKCVLRA